MTFLFGSFFPSYQAYANGKKHIEFNKIHNSSLLNEDLVDKLAKSKVFESYFNSLYILVFSSQLSLSNKSSKQLEEIELKLKNITDSKGTTEDVYKVLNLDVDKSFDLKINELNVKLQNEFPELTLINKVEKEKIIENAIIKGELVTKFLNANDDCIKNASEEYGKCLHGVSWYRFAAAIAGGVCVIALIACVAVAALGTGGSGGFALAVALEPYMLRCVVSAFSFFGAATAAAKCSSQNKVRVGNCGHMSGGGAE